MKERRRMPMSTNAINRTLQVAYPAAIFLAVLASLGMRLVQAGGSDLNHLFPTRNDDRFNRTIASIEVKACSSFDHLRIINHPLTCSDENGVEWTNQTNEGQRFVNNAVQEQSSRGLN